MKFALVVMMVFLVACAEAGDAGESTVPPTTMVETTAEEETVPEYDAEFAPVVGQSRADLATRLDIEESSIEVVSAEPVTWRNGSLGCPQPGMMYTQALVEGSRVVLEHNGRFYSYHAGADGESFLCESDAADGGHDSIPPLEETGSM